jgi:Cft2 family RNA processing exonuclease
MERDLPLRISPRPQWKETFLSEYHLDHNGKRPSSKNITSTTMERDLPLRISHQPQWKETFLSEYHLDHNGKRPSSQSMFILL